MSTPVDFEQAIRRWDKASSDYIAAVYDRFESDPAFISSLKAFFPKHELRRGTSWLLKHHVGKGHSLSADDSTPFLKDFWDTDHWETELHILQSMRGLSIPAHCANNVHRHLLRSVRSERILLRAWAYSGLVVLSEQHKKLRNETHKVLIDAMKTETAGSIVVRIRKGLAEMEKW